MALKWFFIFIFISYLNTVSLQPKVVYKPTEFPYSKCSENGANRVNCEKLNMSNDRQEKESMWPPGPYAIPMCKYGCPESQSRGWSKSKLKIKMVEFSNNSESVSTVLDRNWDPNSLFINDDYFKSPHRKENWTHLYFCVKLRNDTGLDKEQWIPGNYSIYKIGSSCPKEFEESTRKFPVTEFVSHGHVPDIAVSEEGQSEMLTKIIHISICKRKKLADMGYVHTNQTFRLLETDFILEKEADTNCFQFNETTVSQGATYCFYSPKVQSIDYETATELILNQRTLYKLHQDNDFEWYFIDCKRSLEVVMIDIKSSHLRNTYFKCFVSDVLRTVEESSACNTISTTLPGIVYLRRTRGRFFTFALKETITGGMSFLVFISSIEAQNGEACFESIELDDDKQVPKSQLTVSSGTTKRIPTNTNTILTGWIHDATDPTPWILVDLIAVTTIEGVGVYVSKVCDMWTTFSLYFGNNKDKLQLYKDMEFKISPPENLWNIDQVFILPKQIRGRYLKLKHSHEMPTSKSRCLNFKLFGCKLTRITDIHSDKSSEMMPLLEHELISGDSTVLKTNLTRCIELCSIQTICRVASFKGRARQDNGICNHYMNSPIGLWKSIKIINDRHCFAKLQNIVHTISFPRAKHKDGSFFGYIQYVDTDSIITSLSYPFRTIVNSDLQWIVNFKPHQFAKMVFTNVTLSECELAVKTSQVDNNEFIIDENFNDEVFVIETNTSLLFLTTTLTRVWPPSIKFRAIITAEETAACLSIDSLSHSKRTKRRNEICTEPTMILTTLSALNLCQDCEEEFTIQAGEHQSIEITFIYWDTICPYDYYKLQSGLIIEDVDGVLETYNNCYQPEKYKSKGSKIHIQVLHIPSPLKDNGNGKLKGFRLHYKMSSHSLQRYTTQTTKDGNMSLSACSGFFRKCYTVFFEKEKVSWDIANTRCRNNNRQLVTIASKKEMNYVKYLLRGLLYMQEEDDDERELNGAHIGLRRVKDRQMRMNFIWINNNNVTFSDWKRRQPSTGDCTRTSFEYFNTEENWETEDCYNNLVEFYICENTFLVNTTKRDIMEQDVCKMFVKKDLLTSPYSGKTCQNWFNLSDNAKSDFDNNFSSLRDTLENTTVCKDPSGQGVLWCFVSNFDKPVREPCFLHLEDNLSMPEKRVQETKCADGSSIPKINWCDRTFDCIDFTDELSCQNRLKDHDLAIIGNAMMQSNLPKRLKPEAYFTCEHNKELISTLAKCDNVIDCLDASDEVNCFNGCDDNEFSCDGGHCIKFSHVCDFISDCADGTDEKCDFQKCNENEFRCYNKQCIPSEKRCNSKPDCLDKSDEENCESCTNSFLCSGDYKCIPLRLTCDCYPDCTDSSDELTCRSKIPTSADLRNEYVSLVDSKDFSFELQSIGKESGRITATPGRGEISVDILNGYSCITKFTYNCKLRFLEAAVVDNFNNEFGYPCYCTEEMYVDIFAFNFSYRPLMHKYCNGSEITDFGRLEFEGEHWNRVFYPLICVYDFKTTEFGEFFHCKRDDKAIQKSMMCIYAVDANGYMTGCRSGDHLQHCENFTCPANTVKCPGSYCIEQRFLCDGHNECPGGEDEQDCTCEDSDREVILFVEDEDSESRDAAMHLAKQFFTNSENNIVKLFNFNILHRKMKFDIEYRLLEIKVERVTREQGIEETGCKFKTMARDFLKQLKFSELEKRALIVLENSIESSVVASLVLSNISEPSFSIYRVIKDFSSSLYKDNRYRFVKDIHISKWSSLFSIGFRRFPEICTEATIVPCVGMYRCLSSKQCIPFEQVCDDVIHCRNGDDERLCDSVCPEKCNCTGDVINCKSADIIMSDISSLTVQARSLDLSNNPRIKEIPEQNLSFPFMFRLNFSSCDIHYIHKRAFFDLKNLLSLDLRNNRIEQLPDLVFSKLRYLTYLNLDRNKELTMISSTAFKGLKSVRSLKISGTNLKKISSLTFSGLELDSIDISYNRIEEIEDFAFNNSLVHKITFEGNKVITFGEFIFNGVTSLRELHTPAFKFCCIRPCYLPEEYCKPLKNEFSSCEDLMRNSVLQAVLWIVGFASLFGNLSSIIYRLVYDRERLKIGYGIFVTNLAVADFLMGVYLIMIAVADSLYRNRYIFVDDQWRNSNWCITAGVLSTISSEASVLFLCLITLDRLLVIKFPFGTVRFTPMKAYVSCALCWFISIILSVIPILYTSHFQNKFYSRTGVCIALPLTRDKPPGWIYSVSIFVGLNFCTFILVAVGQISIFTELRRSTSAMKKTEISRRRDLKVARNLILVATTDFLCWFPIGVMGILALNGFAIPSDVYAWSAVFILPINSALNPFLYTVTAIIGKKSFNPSLDEQSRTVVQKEIGKAILEYQQLSRSVRMISELVPVGTKRSIQEILDDDSCLSVNVVAALCKELAGYLRLLHDNYIAIDQICEENIYIQVYKTKVNKPIVVIDAKASLAADERALQENIRQFGNILRKLILKCEKGLK